ncbi:MAG: CDP-alcohol phosphatidyltransferase family protein [Desulfobacterota bacterium]|nr:CDP-alcohol phosphatidyltransferase family protein [Thermodesulfobacteriota bacterium]MDW8001331.1 CDP-alcohol phosphatidyltransferase family protein [Deltaproteobacteria bacterium]
MLSAKIGHSLDPYVIKIFRIFFLGKHINPTIITLFGFLLGLFSFLSIVFDYLKIGGIFLIVSGYFDLLDGALARNTRKVTVFGGFLDSVLDRYTDLLVISGIGIHFLRGGEISSVVATIVASIGIAIIPYAKARAQAEGLTCNTGILERPERTILLIFGLIFGLVEYIVIILAILSHITVLQRVIFVRKATQLIRVSE